MWKKIFMAKYNIKNTILKYIRRQMAVNVLTTIKNLLYFVFRRYDINVNQCCRQSINKKAIFLADL